MKKFPCRITSVATEHKCLKCGLIAEHSWMNPVEEEQELKSIRNSGYCIECVSIGTHGETNETQTD